MKFVSYNMQHNKRGIDNWRRLFVDVDPDVVLAQESMPPTTYERSRLDEPESSGRMVWSDTGSGWGSAIYATSPARPIRLPNFEGWLVAAEVEVSSSLGAAQPTVRVFSVHTPGGQGSYQRAVNQILDTIDLHRDGMDIVIGGDFNLSISQRHESEKRKTSTGDRKIQTRLREQFGLINCWQTVHPGVPLEQTLRWDREPKTPYHCDAIFVPDSWSSRLKDCVILSGEDSRGISDHNPVVAEFA